MMDMGENVPDLLVEDTTKSIQQSVDLLEKWHQSIMARIQYAFVPRFIVSCTEELLTAVRDLSKHYQVKVHTHASENRGEIQMVEMQRGMRNVVYLDQIGLANENLILAIVCGWMTKKKGLLKNVA